MHSYYEYYIHARDVILINMLLLNVNPRIILVLFLLA
jgi:hypothetical protein